MSTVPMPSVPMPSPEMTVGRQGNYAGAASRLVAFAADIGALWGLYLLGQTLISWAWRLITGHTYTLTPQADGTTTIDVVLVREGKNFRGLVVAAVLRTVGKRSLAKTFANSVTAIEVRSQHLYL